MKSRFVLSGLLGGAMSLLSAAGELQAAPRKVFAISQQQPSGLAEVAGNPSDSILLYDVTEIGDPGATNVFNNSPMFSVWLGYEIFEGDAGELTGGSPTGVPRGNREDTSAITFNPANGTIYAVAFDSGSTGFPDPVGDTQGDYDLYRINYQALLADFVANSRPAGTVYAPSQQRIAPANEQFLFDFGSPLFDGTADGIAHNVPHPGALTTTVFMDDAIQKIGELGRAQPPFSFFDQELSFVNPEALVMLDAGTSARSGGSSRVAGDFQIRAIQRSSTSPGAATMDADGADNATGPPGNAATDDDYQGGYNANTTESWISTTIARPQMDELDLTDPGGWALVRQNGKLGIWIADNELDNAGDKISYFELDFSGPTPTATKKTLPTSAGGAPAFRVDENPAADATSSNGEVDFLAVDKDGNLVIGESGFFDTIAGSTTPPLGSGGLTAEQPRVLTLDVATYDTPNGPAPSGMGATFDSKAPWSTSASANPTLSDDSDVLNTTKVAYDQSTGYVYIIEQDSDFFEDIYVFDPATGAMVYEELNAFNPGLFNTGTQIVFTRGDINGDGIVNQADVATLQAGIADPTLGGTVSAAVGAEWYDLTGDGLLTAADLAELNSIVGAPLPGDFNGDQLVDAADLSQWKADFGVDGGSDADADGDSDGADFLVWQRNVGASAAAAATAAVPEPTAIALLAAAVAVLTVRRR